MLPELDEYFRHNYNTELTPKEEKAFRTWAKKNQRNPDLESTDYDLRGFWKNQESFAGNGHGSDRYKKPNHPTFSVESQYHGTPSPWGGRWEGGTWFMPTPLESALRGSPPTFTPSATMLRYTHPREVLLRYMNEREPGIRLQDP